jgi:hypothetical protein
MNPSRLAVPRSLLLLGRGVGAGSPAVLVIAPARRAVDAGDLPQEVPAG